MFYLASYKLNAPDQRRFIGSFGKPLRFKERLIRLIKLSEVQSNFSRAELQFCPFGRFRCAPRFGHLSGGGKRPIVVVLSLSNSKPRAGRFGGGATIMECLLVL